MHILWPETDNCLFSTSTLVGHFVSSPSEREKRDRRDSREIEEILELMKERDGEKEENE